MFKTTKGHNTYCITELQAENYHVPNRDNNRTNIGIIILLVQYKGLINYNKGSTHSFPAEINYFLF